MGRTESEKSELDLNAHSESLNTSCLTALAKYSSSVAKYEQDNSFYIFKFDARIRTVCKMPNMGPNACHMLRKWQL